MVKASTAQTAVMCVLATGLAVCALLKFRGLGRDLPSSGWHKGLARELAGGPVVTIREDE